MSANPPYVNQVHSTRLESEEFSPIAQGTRTDRTDSQTSGYFDHLSFHSGIQNRGLETHFAIDRQYQSANFSQKPSNSNSSRSRLRINPEFQEIFSELNLNQPQDFLSLPGKIISGHPNRHVRQIMIKKGSLEHTWYLKCEHRVRIQDRLHNLWQGFGMVSNSIREGTILQELAPFGCAAPFLVDGEDKSGQAFVMVSGNQTSQKIIHVWKSVSEALRFRHVQRLGQLIALLHTMGINHQDLLAKHVWIDPITEKITLLDWQRGQIQRSLSWFQRRYCLASFLATIPENWRTDSLMMAFLGSYQQWYTDHAISRTRLISSVQKTVQELLKRSKFRDELVRVTETRRDQELVWLDGEKLCVVPHSIPDFSDRSLYSLLYDPALNGSTIQLQSGIKAKVYSQKIRKPQRILAFIKRLTKGNTGGFKKLLPMQSARVLFTLEKYGILSPRLLAFGRNETSLFTESFIAYQEVEASVLHTFLQTKNEIERKRLSDALHQILNRLRDIGFGINEVFMADAPIGIREFADGFQIAFLDPRLLSRQKKITDLSIQKWLDLLIPDNLKQSGR